MPLQGGRAGQKKRLKRAFDARQVVELQLIILLPNVHSTWRQMDAIDNFCYLIMHMAHNNIVVYDFHIVWSR